MRPAIVLSAHTMALGVIRSLGARGVPVVVVGHDPRGFAHTSTYVHQYVRGPDPVVDEEAFIALLLAHHRHWQGGVIIPTTDETLVAVSRHRQVLEEQYRVACPPWDETVRFIEKERTYELADRAGVAAPRTIIARSREDVVEYAKAATFPCLLKPSQSHQFFRAFGRKMVLASSAEELLDAYQTTEECGLTLMLQEYIPGGDDAGANYNAFYWEGRPLVEFTAQQVRNAPPKVGSPRVVVSRDIPEVREAGRRLLKAADFSGFACTEFKRDPRDGSYTLMEVNPRHNLSTALAVNCGVDFPWIDYQCRTGRVVEARPVSSYPSGVYWVDTLRDAAYGARFAFQERYRLSQHLEPYRRPHVFAILDRSDMRPFVTRCRGVLAQGMRTGASSAKRRWAAGPGTSSGGS